MFDQLQHTCDKFWQTECLFWRDEHTQKAWPYDFGSISHQNACDKLPAVHRFSSDQRPRIHRDFIFFSFVIGFQDLHKSTDE